MKKILGLLCCGLLGVSSAAIAQTEVNSTTLFSFYEQNTPGFDSKFKAPAYEFLRADVASDTGVGFHVYGWGSAFLDDIGTGGDADFTYGYLTYQTEKANGLIKAGRFYEYLITGIEQLDGVSARADLKGGFTLAAFVGSPSQTPDDNKGDTIVGGQLNWRNQYLQLGVSALTEEGAWSASVDEEADRRQLVGAIFSLTPIAQVMATGNLSYNLLTDDIAEKRLLLVAKPIEKLTLTGEYRVAFFEDYFTASSLPVFSALEEGNERQIAGTVNVQANKVIDVSAFYKNFENSSAGDSVTSNRYGGQIRAKGNMTLGAIQYLRSDGDSAEYSYDEISAYAQMKPTKTIAVGINGLVHLYDEEIFGTDTGYLVGANLNLELTKKLAVNSTLNYEKNPLFDKDVRGFVWLKYDLNI